MLEEDKEPIYLSAGVGEYAVFNCDLDFPHETPIPYVLQWNRHVSIKTCIINIKLVIILSIMHAGFTRKIFFNRFKIPITFLYF